MRITGRNSRTIFNRYNIVSPEDLMEAGKCQAEYLSRGTVTKLGTIGLSEPPTPKKPLTQAVGIT
jgi:hypothetical protein